MQQHCNHLSEADLAQVRRNLKHLKFGARRKVKGRGRREAKAVVEGSSREGDL